MQLAETIMLRLAMMMIYASVGFILFKKKFITNNGTKELGKLLLYIILPCAIIRSYIIERTTETTRGLALSFLLAVICAALTVIIARIIYRGRKPIEEFGAAFSNAGFIGIPLVTAVLGEEAVCFSVAFVTVVCILQFSYGVFLMTGNKSVISLKKIITLPVLISFFVGVAIYFLPFEIPSFFTEILSTVSDMNAPIGMLTVGVYFAQVSIKDMLTRADVYWVSAVRLLIIPILTGLLLWILPIGSSTMKLVVLIQAAAPIGSSISVFAQLYDKDYKTAVEEVVLTMFLSVLTMPVVIGVFEKAL